MERMCSACTNTNAFDEEKRGGNWRECQEMNMQRIISQIHRTTVLYKFSQFTVIFIRKLQRLFFV